MTIEIGGFLGLAALMVGLFAWLRQDVNRLETRMDGRLSDVETQMNIQSSELRERMAKLEGLLEGLRESITGRRAA